MLSKKELTFGILLLLFVLIFVNSGCVTTTETANCCQVPESGTTYWCIKDISEAACDEYFDLYPTPNEKNYNYHSGTSCADVPTCASKIACRYGDGATHQETYGCMGNARGYCNSNSVWEMIEDCTLSGQHCDITVGDCCGDETQYRMAFLLIENLNNLSTPNDIEKINILKTQASETFLWATKGLASLNTQDGVVVLRMEDNPSTQQIANKFYETNGDDYDFLTIYNTYDNSGSQYHIPVQNKVQGIGLGLFDNTANYGSNGTLKGTNWMQDIDMYRVDNNLFIVLGVNGILHETSHQWGAFVDFIDESGQRSNSLRNPYNMAHWDKKLETGYDLLNGFSWEDNGDGTFTARTITDHRNDYSDLDLYLMGLISKDEVSPVTLIVSDADSKFIQPGTTISGTAKIISIQQVIDAGGSRTCIT